MSNLTDSSSAWSPNETSAEVFADTTWLQGALITCVAYGVELNLVAMCARLLLRQWGREKRVQLLVLLVIVGSLFICGTLFVASMARMTQLSFITYRNFPGGPAAYQVTFFYIPIDNMGNGAYMVGNFLADALMLWRGIVIFKAFGASVWLFMGIPALMYIASFILGIFYLIQFNTPNSSVWVSSGVNITLPYFVTSLALNFTVTILIVARLVAFRISISKVLGDGYARYYTNLTAMIIESAALSSTFSLLFLVTFLVNHPIQNVFVQLISQTQIIAPLLIIFRVAEGKAWSMRTVSQLRSTTSSGRALTTLKFSSMSGTGTMGSGAAGATANDSTMLEPKSLESVETMPMTFITPTAPTALEMAKDD